MNRRNLQKDKETNEKEGTYENKGTYEEEEETYEEGTYEEDHIYKLAASVFQFHATFTSTIVSFNKIIFFSFFHFFLFLCKQTCYFYAFSTIH